MKQFSLILAFVLWVIVPCHAQEPVGNVQAAKFKVSMCIGCHALPGYRATFPEVYSVPMLGGQHAKYIELALKAYQKGDRKHPTMRSIAASLSDQDIADLAAYYAQQNARSTENHLK
ncbi:MAG: cytochrome c [Ottowia sp.]|nr:cytochrome c [Ottowia sp.]